MPANHKVNVAWQIFFIFIPVINFWAFYRIRRLDEYTFYIILPAVIALIILIAIIIISIIQSPTESYDPLEVSFRPVPIASELELAAYLVGFGLQGLAIYLVTIWSRKHNQQFDPRPSIS